MASESLENDMVTSLKIQVDNDTNTYNKTISDDNELEEGEATGTDSEDEVEVNVIVDTDIDKSRDRKPKENRLSHHRNDKRIEKSYYKLRKDSKHVSPEDFGADFFPIMSDDKMEGRAIRFGNSNNSSPLPKSELLTLFKSLDLSRDDFERGGWRDEAIHLRGIENLKSGEIFEYFRVYSPNNIEWLNNESCNVVFSKKSAAAKALINLSCPIINKKKKRVFKLESVSEKEKSVDIKATKKVRKKSSEGSKKGSDSSSSSSDGSSSSSSSEDEDSSSDSESSSSSSSDSSSSEDDSSGSSSSSSESEEEEDDKLPVAINKKQPTTNDLTQPIERDEKLPNKIEKKTPTNNNTDDVEMEVEACEEQLGSINAEEVGVPIPPGCWRLGLPCPNAKALLMRYAHCKDKKMPGLDKPVDFFEEYDTKKSRRKKEDDRSRRSHRNRDLRHKVDEKKSKKKEYKQEQLMTRRQLKKERMEWPPPRVETSGGSAGYIDLDNPFDRHTKNPWGFLAHNWSKRATQDNLDYQGLLQQHLLGRKRKHDSESESDMEDDSPPPRKYQSRRREKAALSEDDYNDHSPEEEEAEEESDDDSYDDVDEWRSKIKLPRMRMYADSEEKRKVKRPKEVKKRIGGVNEGRIFGSRGSAPRANNRPGFDLRAKLQGRNFKKGGTLFLPNSEEGL